MALLHLGASWENIFEVTVCEAKLLFRSRKNKYLKSNLNEIENFKPLSRFSKLAPRTVSVFS